MGKTHLRTRLLTLRTRSAGVKGWAPCECGLGRLLCGSPMATQVEHERDTFWRRALLALAISRCRWQHSTNSDTALRGRRAPAAAPSASLSSLALKLRRRPSAADSWAQVRRRSDSSSKGSGSLICTGFGLGPRTRFRSVELTEKTDKLVLIDSWLGERRIGSGDLLSSLDISAADGEDSASSAAPFSAGALSAAALLMSALSAASARVRCQNRLRARCKNRFSDWGGGLLNESQQSIASKRSLVEG